MLSTSNGCWGTILRCVRPSQMTRKLVENLHSRPSVIVNVLGCGQDLPVVRCFPSHPTLRLHAHRYSQRVTVGSLDDWKTSDSFEHNEVSRPSARELDVLPTLGDFSPVMLFSSLVGFSLVVTIRSAAGPARPEGRTQSQGQPRQSHQGTSQA